ncbi:unnamed protein product [Lathyrus oleraceus]
MFSLSILSEALSLYQSQSIINTHNPFSHSLILFNLSIFYALRGEEEKKVQTKSRKVKQNIPEEIKASWIVFLSITTLKIRQSCSDRLGIGRNGVEIVGEGLRTNNFT